MRLHARISRQTLWAMVVGLRVGALCDGADGGLRAKRSELDVDVETDGERLVEELRVHQVELELQNNQLRDIERDLVRQNDQLRSVERELELSRVRYQELFDLAPVGYVRLDARGVIGHANRAADTLLGVAPGRLINRSLAHFTNGLDLRMLRAHLRAAARDPHGCELRLSRSDGSVVHTLLASQPAPGGGCLTVLTDVGERRRAQEALRRANCELEERVQVRTRELAARNTALEEALAAGAASEAERSELAARLRDAERLESLGLLAGGIAHDFNNLLVGVLANADLLLQTLPDLAGPVKEGLDTIKCAAHDGAGLTRQLLVYAGRGQVTLHPVQLDDLLRECLRLLQAGVPERIELRAELEAAGQWIQGDSGQVRQVISNLVTNALEAVGEDVGRIVVRTRLEQLDAPALARFPQRTRAKPGCFVVLEVEDTGAGIEAAHLLRIFEPFYTSKFTGRGLGLASVLGIVRGHDAALRVRSVPGQGSSFEIAWPLADSLTPPKPLPLPQPVSWHGTGRALLVDDDPVVRRALRRQLSELGFSVTQAASAKEALALFRADPSQFRLGVVDRTMPGLCGDELIELLHEIAPALPVILVSGYSASGPVVANERVTFVAKPMTLDDLRRAAAKLLDGQ